MIVCLGFYDDRFAERNNCDQEVDMPAVPRIGEKVDYRSDPITDETGAISTSASVIDVVWHLMESEYAYVVCDCEIIWEQQ